MKITGLPEGVEVAEIRPPVPGDVLILGKRADNGALELKRCVDQPSLLPQLILAPAPGYLFRDTTSRLGYSFVQVIRQFETPVTETLHLVYRDSEQQAKAALQLDHLRALGVLA